MGPESLFGVVVWIEVVVQGMGSVVFGGVYLRWHAYRVVVA